MAGREREQAPAVTPDEDKVLRSVLAAIRQVRYGHVQIVLQDGKVVQIERLEKERFGPGHHPA